MYSGVLYNIKVSWEEACNSMPANVKVIEFSKPTRCRNTGIEIWGEFDVPDESCYKEVRNYVRLAHHFSEYSSISADE
ncbi:unnamed protein product [Brachionus calyciflorus]|uniref:Uncharacterized protein n=1 Tax=Brachionus calyciflorus TaxID=104777 RepID=A0A814N2B6_9BILA|nr:unnamed protein product [Brachionus calyciflorus]